MSDIELKTYNLVFAKVKNSNRKAFQKLFDLYWQQMFIAAKSVVLDEDVAKDIVQDIWLNIWQGRNSLDIQNFEGYMFKSVHYGCFKYLRDNNFTSTHTQAINPLQFSVAADIESRYDLEDTQLVIETTLQAMPSRCQEIFRLSRFDDTSNDEIALKLGVSKRSVENQISLALKSIRQNLILARSSATNLFLLIYSILH
ncbi:RNA polymerase sigma-70 factor, ECF subfamily [Pricia antarctica]|uniref:RNA polymerase sigma-70 factor, ECF subfamily n=1 Tax=Pricia antarctica TaxID=641691 RepID=A0A1G7J2W6_9FLAO|nr:RNA polymerase sigma-70 factor [Pricia antarctica]SDF19231.1 RNA polymerase sigma-70 factor, ECF subfamily [Pricia antarctica]